MEHSIRIEPEIDAQVMAGGNTCGGQEGVLDLQSMLWRPVQRSHLACVGHEMSRGLETAQQSANSNGNGTQNEEIQQYCQVYKHY